MLVVLVVVIAGAVAAGIYLSSPHTTSTSTSSTSASNTTQTSSTSSVGPFNVNYLALNVGFSGGLFEITIQGTGTKAISTVVVNVDTPTPAALCTGTGYGLQFANCIPAAHGQYTAIPISPTGFAGNSTFSGFATGKGPGSAVAGQSYNITLVVTYNDNSIANQTIVAMATAGG